MKIKKVWTVSLYTVLISLALTGCEGVMDPSEPGNLVPKTVIEDSSIPAIELNGSRFHVETFGNPENPVIIFLHGGPGGDFRELYRLKDTYDGYKLTDEYFLVFWDQRGAGLSQRHTKDELKHDVYNEDLKQFIEYYSPEKKVVFIGHSWGSMYATMFINKYPEYVRGAVLSEPGPLDAEMFDTIKDDILEMNFFSEWLNDYAWSNQFFTADDHARWDYQHMLGLKNSQPKFHMEMHRDPSPFWRLGAAASFYIQDDGMDSKGNAVYNFTDNLHLFTTKVLFIASGRNEVIGKDFQEKQVKKYPNAELKIVPDCGHDLVWQKSSKVYTLIRLYLDEIK
ncbi:alpha/beta fold hydrolase [Candidatus Latescibacterota bacterium]